MNFNRIFDILTKSELNYMLIGSVTVLLVVFVAYLVNNMIFYFVESRLPKYMTSPIKIFRAAVRIIIIIVGTISLLENWGIDLYTLIAGFGITGFMITFALKDVLTSILSGVMILIYRPFKVGNKILVEDIEGAVVKIDLQYTTVLSKKREYMIPNTKVFADAIIIKE